MKGALPDGKSKVRVTEVPMPEIDDYEYLCQTDACPACTGDEQKLIMGEMSRVKPEHSPVILRHESVGTIIKVCKNRFSHVMPPVS